MSTIPLLDPEKYQVVWIAPLEIEARAALHMLDEHHQGRFPVSRGDDYVFHAGSMCGHNVVIATLPAGQEYGTGSAAALASQAKKFFRNLWFGLLVGVAAGLPDLSRDPPRDIRLGDVLVGLPEGESAGLIAYELGKETIDGFQPLRFGHVLATTEPIVRSAIGSIKIHAPDDDARMFLPYYEAIRSKKHAAGTFIDPGQDLDKLYRAEANTTETLIVRERRHESKRTRVWYGPIGSGEKLFKNAQKKNELRDKYGVIGLEMEAAGTMNRIPVGVIRGVCDYGDYHKNKEWQPYAAAMAAAYAKAVLSQIPHATVERSASPRLRRHCYIPLPQNHRFTGRDAVLGELRTRLFLQQYCQKFAILGLGGMGKTQVALEFAYWVKETQPDYSVLWLSAANNESFEQAYAKIARRLDIRSHHERDDPKELVQQYLERESTGKWFLVVDNADEMEVLHGSGGILRYLPENCIALFTTRSPDVAACVAGRDVLNLEEMNFQEATSLLEKLLNRQQLIQDERAAVDLLGELTHLPLAIAQAAAYFNRNRQVSVQKYLELIRATEDGMVGLMSRRFHDTTLFQQSQRAVATTWLVSFDQIRAYDQNAANLLSFVSCIEPKGIPRSILPLMQTEEETEYAIGTLCEYAFLTSKNDGKIFDMHPLAHMAMRVWIRKHGLTEQTISNAITHLAKKFPSNHHSNRDLWGEYLPHAFRMLDKSSGWLIDDRYKLFDKVGNCLSYDRRFKEAIRCYEKVCRWKKTRLPKNDASRLYSKHQLASAYLDDRRVKDATKILEYVVKIQKRLLAETDNSRLNSEHELAVAYLNDGRVKDATKILEHVVRIRKRLLAETDNSRLDSEHELARAYLDDGRVKNATKILEHVVKMEKELLAEDDHSRLASEHALARAYLDDGRVKDATKILEHVVKMEKELLAEDDHSRLASEHALARAYLADNRVQEAIKIFEHVVKIKKKLLAEDDHSRLASEHKLAQAYYENGNANQAVKLLNHVVAVEARILAKDDPDRLLSLDLLRKATDALSRPMSRPMSRQYPVR